MIRRLAVAAWLLGAIVATAIHGVPRGDPLPDPAQGFCWVATGTGVCFLLMVPVVLRLRTTEVHGGAQDG